MLENPRRVRALTPTRAARPAVDHDPSGCSSMSPKPPAQPEAGGDWLRGERVAVVVWLGQQQPVDDQALEVRRGEREQGQAVRPGGLPLDELHGLHPPRRADVVRSIPTSNCNARSSGRPSSISSSRSTRSRASIMQSVRATRWATWSRCRWAGPVCTRSGRRRSRRCWTPVWWWSRPWATSSPRPAYPRPDHRPTSLRSLATQRTASSSLLAPTTGRAPSGTTAAGVRSTGPHGRTARRHRYPFRRWPSGTGPLARCARRDEMNIARKDHRWMR
jgi:hypothetical protein